MNLASQWPALLILLGACAMIYGIGRTIPRQAPEPPPTRPLFGDPIPHDCPSGE